MRPAPRFAAVFHSADQHSLEAQNTYVLLIGVGVSTAVFGAVLAAPAYSQFAWARWVSFVLLLVGLLAPALAVKRRLREEWYLARAIAESAKSTWWVCFARAGVFAAASSDEECRELYATQLGSIVTQVKQQGLGLIPESTTADDPVAVSSEMSQEERASYYLKHRLNDQRGWYAAKAAANKLAAVRAVWCYGAVVLVLVTTAAAEAAGVSALTGSGGAIGALAATIVAWVELKRFEELFQSYAIAAQELTLLADLGGPAREVQLPKLVLEAEHAISREHTLWIARRTGTSK